MMEIVGLAGWLRDSEREPPSRAEVADEIEALYAEINRLQAQIEELKRARIPAWVYADRQTRETENVGQNPEPTAG